MPRIEPMEGIDEEAEKLGFVAGSLTRPRYTIMPVGSAKIYFKLITN
jgi:hypothetical protein